MTAPLSTFRLYLLRATYLFMLVGLALTVWPVVIQHPHDMPMMAGVVQSLLATVGVLAAIGIRYPVQMLPLMFFELIWKVIWLGAYVLPLWLANRLPATYDENIFACMIGLVIFPVVIPWHYVFDHYVRKPGDRWTRTPRHAAGDAGTAVVS